MMNTTLYPAFLFAMLYYDNDKGFKIKYQIMWTFQVADSELEKE